MLVLNKKLKLTPLEPDDEVNELGFHVRPTIKKYQIVHTKKQLKALSEKLMQVKEFAFDTETNTLKVLGNNSDFKIVDITISWGKDNNYDIPLGHVREEDYENQLPLEKVVKYLRDPFERTDVQIDGQNLKFDMHVMSRIGINIQTEKLFDTMVASWLCDENTPNGLKENTQYYLGIDQTHFKDVVCNVPAEVKKAFGLKAASKATFDLVLIEEGAKYALDDAFYTWELAQGFKKLLQSEKMDGVFYNVFMPFVRTLYDMEERGVTVDLAELEDMKTNIEKDMEELEYKIFELAGTPFNISSKDQLSALLFGYVKKGKNLDAKIKPGEKSAPLSVLLDKSFNFKSVGETGTGAPSTDKKALWSLAHKQYKNSHKNKGVELCTLLLDYKKLEKLKTAFIDGISAQLYNDGKVHPSFNICGTDSGRISCSNPNLQQLPKADEEDKYQIRKLFIGSQYVADKSTDDFVSDNRAFIDLNPTHSPKYCVKRRKIIALDFANLEMRVLAHFSEDKNLLNMFASGADTHSDTAVKMFELKCPVEEVKKKYPHLRQAAKTLNFMLMYGGGAMTLYNNLKDDRENPIDLGDESYLKQYHVKTGEEVAQCYIDRYFDTYSGVAKFIKNQKRFAHRNGYVYTLLNRKRRLPDINSSDKRMSSYCERLSVNSTIQGSAADITTSAQNRINDDPWFKAHGVYMIIQVHDEIVLECPEKYVDKCIEKVKWYMEHSFGDDIKLNLPMVADADSGDSYQEAK